MTNNELQHTPWYFWVVSVLAVLWNSVGAIDFTATVTNFEPYMSAFSDELRAYFASFDLWVYVVWGAATIGSFVASIFLVLRKKLAVTLFAIATIAVLINMGWALTLDASAAPEGASNPPLSVAIVIIAIALLLFARLMAARGVLK